MAIDVKAYKKRFLDDKPSINLVPFIDILFTIMIFLVITSNFSATEVQTNTSEPASSGTGKPNITDTSGNAEYYIMPVANLHKVTVNGVDRSDAIYNGAVAIHAQVIDKGQISIKPGEIIITTPPGISVEKAVHSPKK